MSLVEYNFRARSNCDYIRFGIGKRLSIENEGFSRSQQEKRNIVNEGFSLLPKNVSGDFNIIKRPEIPEMEDFIDRFIQLCDEQKDYQRRIVESVKQKSLVRKY